MFTVRNGISLRKERERTLCLLHLQGGKGKAKHNALSFTEARGDNASRMLTLSKEILSEICSR